MEQHEPERLSPAQRAAMRRSLTNGRLALTRRSLLRASAGRRARRRRARGADRLRHPAPRKSRRRGRVRGPLGARRSGSTSPTGPSTWTSSDDGKHRPTLEAFTERTGIEVKYTEDINDNVEFFGKIKPQLAAGQDTGRDLICVTDWLAARHDPPRLDAEAGPGQPAARLHQPLRPVPRPRLGPRPRLLLPLEGHPRGHRVQQEGDRRKEGHLRLPAAGRPRSSRAGSGSSPRCATASA